MIKKSSAEIPRIFVDKPGFKCLQARFALTKNDGMPHYALRILEMIQKKLKILALMLAFVLGGSPTVYAETTKTLHDVLYQVSTSNAIVVGAFDGVRSSGELKHHGNFG